MQQSSLVTESDDFKEHPFAPFVRILGKGRRGSRALTFEEAVQSMGMIMRGQVEPIQLGAFLMLLRVKEETSDELAGFVTAVKQQINAPALAVDLDWSSYAGKRRHSPWFILSLRLLARAGLRIFIHGAGGHTQGRLYTESVLAQLGFPAADNWQAVEQQLAQHHFSYLPLRAFAPRLAEIIDLKPIMGLRSPVHSLARLLNPLDAPLVMQGIFHPPYALSHQKAGLKLGYRRLAVIKGEGGEIERNPDAALTLYRARCEVASAGVKTSERPEPGSETAEGILEEVQWPALFEQRHVKPEQISADALSALWQGTLTDEYGEAAVIATAALALHESEKAPTQEAALSLARQLWLDRHQ